MQTRPYAITTLLSMIRTHRFRIPQFQRDFTWNNPQIRLLIDSMGRNYPMGSLLVLAKHPEVRLQCRAIEAEIQDVENLSDQNESQTDYETDTDNLFYVLDGQQRITSIARVFLNCDPKNAFYFDLKEMLESYELEEVDWIKFRRRPKKDTDRRKNNREIRADIAMDQSKAEVYVSEYIEDSDDFPNWGRTEKREKAAKVKKVFETLRNYQVPIVVLENDSGLESVCRVFETINSTGTRLTTFDLAVARFFPDPDLRSYWEEALATYPVLNEFEVDGERVLQLIVIHQAMEKGRALTVNRSAQLSLDQSYINSKWALAVDSLSEAYEWAKSLGARPKTLSNHALLVAIGAFHCTRPGKKIDDLLLKRWFFSHLLQPGATQAANYRIAKYFQSLLDLSAGKTTDIPAVNITAEDLLKLKSGADSRYKAIQCLLSAAVRQDLVSGKGVADVEVEVHHIFPKAYCKAENLGTQLCNSIVNLIVLSKETNRDLRDKAPELYLGEVYEVAEKDGTVPGLQSRLKACFFPNANEARVAFLKQLVPSNFETFLNQRAKLLIGEIHSVIGDSLISDEREEDSEQDD